MSDYYDGLTPEQAGAILRNDSLWEHWRLTGWLRKRCNTGSCKPQLLWWLLWPKPWMCRACWKRAEQTYVCTICRRVRNQGDAPRQYLCTDCHHRIRKAGLHGVPIHRHDWKDPGYKSKWDPVSDDDMEQLRVEDCPAACAFTRDKHLDVPMGHDWSCETCGCTGVVLRRLTPLELLAEQAE